MTYVLANFLPKPTLWSFYDNKALAIMARSNDPELSLYSVLTEEEYRKRQAAYYLTECREITERAYNYALNVLPPMNWGTHKCIPSFFMCEFLTGTITGQYAKANGRFFEKTIDFLDKSTWMSTKDLDNAKSVSRLKYHSTDSDNCRVYYINGKGELFAFQIDHGKYFKLHTATECGEPEIPIDSWAYHYLLEPANGNDDIDERANWAIKNYFK